MELLQYIQAHWDETVRLEREGNGDMIGLPYAYYVPCMEGMFQELYYWDSFFTGKGLLLCGREELVKSTVDNMLWLVEQFGYMPNGSHRGLLGRSQPPFLSEMVKDVYAVYGDKNWLAGAYGTLCREYRFWQERRSTACGLSRYGYNMENGRIARYGEMIRKRLSGLELSGWTDEELVENYMSDAESGWDFNPRCGGQQTDFAYVDLNSILYAMEENMAFFAAQLNNGEESLWQERAERRKEKIQSLLYDGAVFLDYNVKSGEHSEIFSCASYYPLWAKAATTEQAESLRKNLYRIEEAFGLAVCEKGPRDAVYQWDYPNGWAPLHYLLVHGLDQYGYREDAERIAEKYVSSMERIFAETGTLWEKYNVTDGSIQVNDEYEMPPMLGWTAGVYLDLKHYLSRGQSNSSV